MLRILFSVFVLVFIITNTHASSVVERMRLNANDFIATLTPAQKAVASLPYNSELKKKWRYFPSSKLPSVFPEHSGLKIGELSPSQEAKVLELVESALSDQGMETVKIIRVQDSDPNIKRKLQEKALFRYGKENYFITFFGNPHDSNWMWRFEGHHISLNINIENGKIVSATPFFLGINPTEYVYEGAQIKTHQAVVSKIRQLNGTLTQAQLANASSCLKELPKDLKYTPSLLGKNQLPNGPLPKGLSVGSLNESQRSLVMEALNAYLDNLNEEGKTVTLSKILIHGEENLEFIFIGDHELNGQYYWRIQGPTFIFEFMTADKSSKHYHVAWQDLK